MSNRFFLNWLILLLVSLTTGLQAQIPLEKNYYLPRHRLKFATDSYETGDYEAASTEARMILRDMPGYAEDSLHFLAARALHKQNKLQQALLEYGGVSPAQPELYRYSLVVLALHSPPESQHTPAYLDTLKAGDDKYRDYALLIQSLNLLEAVDTTAYRELRQRERIGNLYVRKSMQDMDLSVSELGKAKTKSPLLAGFLSALVPGAGRVYNGNWGTGLTSFLTFAGTGIQAWEGYRKQGLNSPQFIVFSAATGFIYLANIYGTIVQTKWVNARITYDFQHRIRLEANLAFSRLFAR